MQEPNCLLITFNEAQGEIYRVQYAFIEGYKGDPYDTANVTFPVGSNQGIMAIEDATPRILLLAKIDNEELGEWHLGRTK